MTKAWEWIKKWGWAFILGLVTLLAIGRKPSWVRKKEKEIQKREQEISDAETQSKLTTGTYEEVIQSNDENIEQANKPQGVEPVTDHHSAADIVNDAINKGKR